MDGLFNFCSSFYLLWLCLILFLIFTTMLTGTSNNRSASCCCVPSLERRNMLLSSIGIVAATLCSSSVSAIAFAAEFADSNSLYNSTCFNLHCMNNLGLFAVRFRTENWTENRYEQLKWTLYNWKWWYLQLNVGCVELHIDVESIK